MKHATLKNAEIVKCPFPLFNKQRAKSWGFPDWIIATIKKGKIGAFSIKECSATDASVIKNWILDDDEHRYLGGTHSTPQEDVLKWIKEGPAFILYGKPKDKPESIPLAFINIQCPVGAPNENVKEIGRLLVNIEYRKNGIGSFLFSHISNAIIRNDKRASDGRGPNHLLARCVDDNKAGQRTLDRTQLKRTHSPPWTPKESENYIWYQYDEDLAGDFGPALQNLRKDKRMEQEELAQAALLTRGSISQYENSRATPSPLNFHRIALALNLSRHDRIKLILSIYGETMAGVTIGKTIDEELKSTSNDNNRSHFNLWVVSNQLAESFDNHILNDSTDAISQGYERYYFVPEGDWHDIKESVAKPMRQRLEKLRIPKDNMNLLKFFLAPPMLCVLRIAIKNPTSRPKPRADEVTIATPGGTRLAIDEEAAGLFIRHLYSPVIQLDRKQRDISHGIKLQYSGGMDTFS